MKIAELKPEATNIFFSKWSFILISDSEVHKWSELFDQSLIVIHYKI